MITLQKEESLKKLLDARQLITYIDKTKCSRKTETIQINLTRIGETDFFLIADMNSTYNQMPFDKISQRFKKVVSQYSSTALNAVLTASGIGPATFLSIVLKYKCSKIDMPDNMLETLNFFDILF